MSQGAKPRRLIITIALAPAARTPSSASQVSACSGPERGSASRMSTSSTGGMRQAVDPARQLQARQLQPGLRARRRGAGDEHGAAVLGAVAGDGAGVVGRVALLLVGGVVLLVDDDQAEVADRGEDGRARADADARLAAAQPPPLVVALAGREGRVEDREAVAEAGAEAGDGLRGEADLGDEDDRAAAALQRRLDRGQVDLGLARAGDAVEQLLARRAGLAVERGDDRVDRAPAARAAASGGSAGGARGRSRAGARRRRELAGGDQAALARAGAASGGRSRPRWPARRADISPARSASSTARCFDAEPLAAAQRRLAGGQDLGPQLDLGADRAAAAPVPVPGGSTSCRPREGVEQYSRATQRPSPTSSGGAPASSASIGSASRSGGSSEASASSTTTPSSAPRPEGDADDAADLELLHRLRPAVVERAPQGAGGGQRLDPEDRHPVEGMARAGTARPQPWRAPAEAHMLARREPQPQPRRAGDLRGPPVLAGDPRLLPERDRRRGRSSASSRS